MIFCNIEPGLVMLNGLRPEDDEAVDSLLDALVDHLAMIRAQSSRVPTTAEYLNAIYQALNETDFRNSPLNPTLKKRVLNLLGRFSQPTPASGITDAQVTPDLVSSWIDERVRRLWLECLASSVADECLDAEAHSAACSVVATWPRLGQPREVALESEQLATVLERGEETWTLPVLANEQDWKCLQVRSLVWPDGLADIRLEDYARRELGISDADLAKRHEVRFDDSCLRNIGDEADDEVRRWIVEVVARRAYDLLEPRHNDETIRSQTKQGMRRIYVHKTNPCVRFHYYLDDTAVVFTLYSNSDHDEGLRKK